MVLGLKRPIFPRRRQRFWRFVSPRRRIVALVTLAVMMSAGYGYWYFTNDHRVRHEAQRYLESYTGWRVKIGRGAFSLFGGITLEDVKIFVPGDNSPYPMFQAKKISMPHRIWSLASGEFKPQEISVDHCIVTLVFDSQKGLGSANLLASERSNWSFNGSLPPIRLKNGVLRAIRRTDGLSEPPVDIPLNVTLLPAGEPLYKVTVETTTVPPVTLTRKFNLATGEVTETSGLIENIENLASSLPGPYGAWLRRYKLTGSRAEFRQIEPAGGKSPGVYQLEMSDLSLQMPPEEGGLEFRGVRGVMLFDSDGVTFKDVTGQVVQAGDASFKITGRYEGYDSDSPFDLNFEMQQAQLPDPESVKGPARALMENVISSYHPSGKASLSVHVSRDAAGAMKFRGSAEPLGMSVLYQGFPLAVSDVRGKVSFDDTKVTLEDVTARRGGMKIKLSGFLATSGQSYDVQTQAHDADMDSSVRKALPQQFQGYWDMFAPGGKLDATVRVYRGGPDDYERVALTLGLDGRASMTYRDFPYPLEGLRGSMKVQDNIVTLDLTEGHKGKGSCSIQGTIRGIGSDDCETNLNISAREIAIDDTLRTALGNETAGLMNDLKLSGTAQRAVASVHHIWGKPIEYNVQTTVAGVSFTAPTLPYEVTGAAGQVVIEPNAVTIQKLAGKHGDAKITVSGTVMPTGSQGLDLRVQAADLPADKTLYEALPDEPKRWWRRAAPEGKLDVDMTYRQNMSGQKAGEADYEITLMPQGIKVCCEDFPYPVENVKGKVIITPGKIELSGVLASHGQMHAGISGTIGVGENGQAVLAINAKSVPIDQELLSALPQAAKPLTGCLKKSGTCDIEFKRLRLGATPASLPATAGSNPATMPSAEWEVDGSITFHDAVMDMGFGDKLISGTISGSAGIDSAGQSVDAEAKLDSLEAGGRKATELAAKIQKTKTSSIVRIGEISGKALGGRLAGAAEIRLSQPMECGLQLEVNDIKLQELDKAPAKDDPKENKVEGLLAGNIRLRTKVGDAAGQQAEGELWISKAKLTQMPVLLDLHNILMVKAPGEGPYTEGVLRYELKGSTLLFNEIYLTSQGMSVVGSGKVDTKTEAMRLTFLARPGGKMPRMDSLSDMLTPLVREISEIRITGTLKKPIPRTVPLSSLDTAVRKLLNPSKDD